MITAIPFFGSDPRYLDMLQKWLYHYNHRSGCLKGVVIFTPDDQDSLTFDEATILPHRWAQRTYDLSSYADVIRPDQPFDIKGALMCELALSVKGPIMMLDADALLQKDYTPIVEPIMDCIFAMPVDDGAALSGHKMQFDAPYETATKMCAGVTFFGSDLGSRPKLVKMYREAWKELLAADIPWTPRLPHLLEQYAWSLVHHRLNQPRLPRGMNWAPHIRNQGENEHATVYHYFGHKKWKGTKAPVNV